MPVMTVIFNDSNLPEHTREFLAEEATKILLRRFGNVNAAKEAFDRHRVMPSPSDPTQAALTEVLETLSNHVKKNFGPTAARSLHPIVKFD